MKALLLVLLAACDLDVPAPELGELYDCSETLVCDHGWHVPLNGPVCGDDPEQAALDGANAWLDEKGWHCDVVEVVDVVCTPRNERCVTSH